METWLTLGVLFVRPGANSATSDGVRPVGSASISLARKLSPPVDWASIEGVAAVTSTSSVTIAGCITASRPSIDPTPTRNELTAGCSPAYSKVMV